MLEKILPFLDDQTVTQIYYLVYEILGKIFGVDTGRYTDRNKEAILWNIIQRVATLGNFEVAVTKRR